MINPQPIPEELWANVPPEAQAALAAVFLAMRQRVDALETRAHDLEARLKLNSTNSSKPPSSDPIGLKRKPPAPPTGRNRGGQPGHPKAQRPLVPPEKLRSSTDCRPTTCRRCAHPLLGDDPEPLIHQVADLPRIEPIVDQFRLHRLTCAHCGETPCGALPAGVPTGSFSPYTRGGRGEKVGRRLLGLSDRLFEIWHRSRDGTPGASALGGPILGLRPRVRRALRAGLRCGCARTAATCAEILRVEEGLWNFVWFPGVEPTNNAAERALRHAVIWRRISGGTASESGSRFVERMLTVVATCRQRGRDVLEYLTSCFEAHRKHQVLPSLLPVTEPAIKAA